MLTFLVVVTAILAYGFGGGVSWYIADRYYHDEQAQETGYYQRWGREDANLALNWFAALLWPVALFGVLGLWWAHSKFDKSEEKVDA